MELVLGRLKKPYLEDIRERNRKKKIKKVQAAVAYATDETLLFDWCWDNNIPLEFYGRLDGGVPVDVKILKSFLKRKSRRFTCSLVKLHHAKIIWWHGAGVYIGSANLTKSAWCKNVEAGCYFTETEIDNNKMRRDLISFFVLLKNKSIPLDKQLLENMKERDKEIKKLKIKSKSEKKFINKMPFGNWDGLVDGGERNLRSTRRNSFINEWHSTMDTLRDIGDLVCLPRNRPKWVPRTTLRSAQIDQFLNTNYCKRQIDRHGGIFSRYDIFFERNKNRKEQALEAALYWWRNSPKFDEEFEILNTNAPFLHSALQKNKIKNMQYEKFKKICSKINAFVRYANSGHRDVIGIPDDGESYPEEERISRFLQRIWEEDDGNGKRIKSLLLYLLYGGTDNQLPERLWNVLHDENRKIKGLGTGILGEFIGYALPNEFPIRNGRTVKSLRSLGYDVKFL